MGDIAIQAEGLGKSYHISGKKSPYKTLRETLVSAGEASIRRLRGEQQTLSTTFWALQDVTFDVKRGDTLGIIGRNGAGKSTLLKILSRITKPSRGSAMIYGRLGSLLEVGTGFHTELSGRENIYLNGAILGMSRREIQRKFDEIVAFAEVEKFLDTPVKYYSSGMYVRLAFAVAAHLEPEILVVDEVLAVGDAAFQEKSLGKMSEVAREGRTVLFVSHQMNAIQNLCSSAILLDHGKIIERGSPRAVIAHYLDKGETSNWVVSDETRIENPYFSPTEMYIVNTSRNRIVETVSADDTIGVVIEGQVTQLNVAFTLGFAVYASGGELLFWSLHTDTEREKWPKLKQGHNKLVGWIPSHFLNEGDYRIELMSSLHNTTWISRPGANAPFISVHVRGDLSKSPYWMIPRPGLAAPILRFESLD